MPNLPKGKKGATSQAASSAPTPQAATAAKPNTPAVAPKVSLNIPNNLTVQQAQALQQALSNAGFNAQNQPTQAQLDKLAAEVL